MRRRETMRSWRCARAWKAARALAVCAAAHLLLSAFPQFAAHAAPIPWRSPTYTLVARDMDLRTALDTFAVAQGLSVSMSPSVSGVFSASSVSVPTG